MRKREENESLKNSLQELGEFGEFCINFTISASASSSRTLHLFVLPIKFC